MEEDGGGRGGVELWSLLVTRLNNFIVKDSLCKRFLSPKTVVVDLEYFVVKLLSLKILSSYFSNLNLVLSDS